jgi:alkylated DNA repair dioxygenase AlkB
MNLLPYDGELYYIQNFLNESDQNYFVNGLLENIDWRNDEVIIFGKKIITARKVAWYAENNISYTYSGKLKIGKEFTTELKDLKNRVIIFDNTDFNSCLLNLYHSGEEGMSWHSDNEKEIHLDSCIASISLGATRYIDFKHKINKTKIRVNLEPGSLLLMKGSIQKHWLHALPKTKKVKDFRINLTYRLLHK